MMIIVDLKLVALRIRYVFFFFFELVFPIMWQVAIMYICYELIILYLHFNLECLLCVLAGC